MISKKNLARKIQALIALLKDCESLADQQWKKEAFLDAYSMCMSVATSIDSDDYGEAVRLWRQLERFVNDSIPTDEDFLSRYMPLRQSIINFGMQ